MKKHELLKYAYDNYPKGTKFKNLAGGEECTSSGIFEFSEYGILNSTGIKNYIYGYKEKVTWGDKWAEIVKPKIAVKVESDKEFKALERHLCVQHNDSVTFPLYAYPDELHKYVGWDTDPDQVKNHKIIPFSEFAEQHAIKLPHITTHYGIDLYIGDYLACVWKRQGEWELTQEYPSIHSNTVSEAGQSALEGERKLFSTKQAALDWIDAQKPKRDFLTGGEVYFEITDECVWFYGKTKKEPHPVHFITKSDLKIINEKLKSLH